MRSIKSTLITTFCLMSCLLFAQEPIDLAESILKIGFNEDQILYFGFADGDQIVFDFEVIKGKTLKEIEIVELQNTSSKFMDYEVRKIDNKTISITSTGIYKFRFSNPTLKGRVCRYKIQRIPAPDNEGFNSNVFWKTVYDTTYTIISENYLISKDTVIHEITNQVAKVHSATNVNGNRSSFPFSLPKNTVSWSYYVGVGQRSADVYQEATEELANLAMPLSKLPGFGPLAAVALGFSCFIPTLQKGEDVNYCITDDLNKSLFYQGVAYSCYKHGLVINEFSQMTSPRSGTLFFCLHNDNLGTGVSVSIIINAITITENWGKRPIQKVHISSTKVPYLR